MEPEEQKIHACLHLILAMYMARRYNENEAEAIRKCANALMPIATDKRLRSLLMKYTKPIRPNYVTINGKRIFLSGDKQKVYSIESIERDMRTLGVLSQQEPICLLSSPS